MKTIAIITCVIPNMVTLCENLVKSGEEIKSNEYKLKWYYISSLKNIENISGMSHLAHCNVNIDPSVNHASALHMIYDYQFNEDIIMIIDCDCCFKLKNWDKTIVNLLENNDIISVNLSRKDAPRGNDTHRKFPSVFFMAMSREKYFSLNIDFHPTLEKTTIKAEINNNIKVKLDTGYKICDYLGDVKYFNLQNIAERDGTQSWYYNESIMIRHLRRGRQSKRHNIKL